jgi:hypothetical protein
VRKRIVELVAALAEMENTNASVSVADGVSTE